MRPIPPLNPWVTKALFFFGGYVLRWWASDVAGKDDGEAQWATQRQARKPRPAARAPPPTEELKLVLVVNDSLKMGKGKTGAQCAHAAVGIFETLVESKPALLQQWEDCGQPKICLKAKDDVEMRALAKSAAAAGLPTFSVHDAGRTQVAAGSLTVLAIGPAAKSAIDTVTGHLRLL